MLIQSRHPETRPIPAKRAALSFIERWLFKSRMVRGWVKRWEEHSREASDNTQESAGVRIIRVHTFSLRDSRFCSPLSPNAE